MQKKDSWCFESSQPQKITSELKKEEKKEEKLQARYIIKQTKSQAKDMIDNQTNNITRYRQDRQSSKQDPNGRATE